MKTFVTLSDLVYFSYPVIPLRWHCALARVHGTVLHLTQKQTAVDVRDNLAGVNPRWSDKELHAMVRRSFQYKSLRNLLFILAPKLTDDVMSRLFAVDGLHRLDQALAASGKGVILLATHLNSLSVFLLVVMLRRRGYDIRVALVIEEDRWSSSWLRSTFNRLTRQRTYFEHIGAFYCQFNIRPIVRALADRAVVLQTGDGWHSAGFVEVEFMNQRVAFTTGMLRIAQQTGATVVPIFTDGAPPDRIRFVIEEPFTVPTNEPVDASVAAFARRLEHYLLANVECWEHWLIANALQTMAGWPQQTLEKRYTV